jgi:hypothetical protein
MSDNLISLSTAITLTSQFRSDKETVLATAYKNTGIMPICETFAQTGCESVRAYLAMDTNLKVRLIFVGVNSMGADMVDSSSDTNIVVETGIRCPTTCPPSSVLNTD